MPRTAGRSRARIILWYILHKRPLNGVSDTRKTRTKKILIIIARIISLSLFLARMDVFAQCVDFISLHVRLPRE